MTPIIFLINSLLILIGLTAFFSGLVYRFYRLNNYGVAVALTLAFIFLIIIQYYYFISNKKTRPLAKAENNKTELKVLNILLFAAYCALIAACFYVLAGSRTDSAIISPWQTAPKYFFALYGLATLTLIGNLIINKKLSLLLITLHYFLSFSVALIIYRLGYGFDPFIHQATENLISQTGAVEPRPFYYLGQYGLVVILHKISGASLIWIDRLLLPASAALFLPAALWRVLKSWFPDRKLNLILILALPALTFPFLIVTTPQNLAYLLLIIVILYGLVCKNFYDFLIILLLALAAAITQPVAGIPALLFCGFLAVYHGDSVRLKKYFYPLLIAAAILVLPALFYLLGKIMPDAEAAAGVPPAAGAAGLNWPGRENFILNFIYLYGFNLKLITAAFIIGGLALAWKFRQHCRALSIYLVIGLSLLVSYSLVQKISFAFLIDYERENYADRILFAASLFFLPFIMIALYALGEKILKQNFFFKLSFAVLLAVLASVSLYLSYPRKDSYFNSRGYSFSAADLEAVGWINADARGDFIVLANQQVSAAALSRFGFKKYYQTPAAPVFYYPLPTGSPLYRYYLDMVYKQPSRETALEAVNSVRADQAYFVLNNYWWAFDKILAEAKLSADSFKNFGNGEVYVFKYVRN